MFDNLDNCPLVWNEDQADTNQDSPEGDACEILEAVVTIQKTYQGPIHPQAGEPQVEVTLTCPEGVLVEDDVDGDPNVGVKTTAGLEAQFNVSNFADDGSDICVATETPVAGWVEEGAADCDAISLTVDPVPTTCVFTNRPTEATFSVIKTFDDGNNVAKAAVEVSCTDNGSGPGIVLDPVNGQGDAWLNNNFTATVRFFDGAANCQATEDDVALVGYSLDDVNSTCLADTTISDNDAGAIPENNGSCSLVNLQDPITILASKIHTGGGPAATFEATCTDGGTVVTPIKTTASPGSPAEFEISNLPFQGTTCAVTEPVPPAGTYETASSCNGLAIAPSDDDTLCEITNSPTIAWFEVTKEFTDGDNPTEVEVTISCFTGLPLIQNQTIDEIGSGVNFVVTSFNQGELDCDITEDLSGPELLGYEATYYAGKVKLGSKISCSYEDVEGGVQHYCEIRNDALPVEIAITKDWVISGTGGNSVDQHFELTLYCNAPIGGGGGSGGSGSGSGSGQAEGDLPLGDNFYCGIGPVNGQGKPPQPALFCQKFYGVGDSLFTTLVTPRWPTSHCWVEETVYDDYVEIDNPCDDIGDPGLTISHGKGASCLITNTVFFEGIPTLSQYGMAILALLMLGVGLLGFRRFA